VSQKQQLYSHQIGPIEM